MEIHDFIQPIFTTSTRLAEPDADLPSGILALVNEDDAHFVLVWLDDENGDQGQPEKLAPHGYCVLKLPSGVACMAQVDPSQPAGTTCNLTVKLREDACQPQETIGNDHGLWEFHPTTLRIVMAHAAQHPGPN